MSDHVTNDSVGKHSANNSTDWETTVKKATSENALCEAQMWWGSIPCPSSSWTEWTNHQIRITITGKLKTSLSFQNFLKYGWYSCTTSTIATSELQGSQAWCAVLSSGHHCMFSLCFSKKHGAFPPFSIPHVWMYAHGARLMDWCSIQGVLLFYLQHSLINIKSLMIIKISEWVY